MRELDVAAALRAVREQAPLVHAVSNIVTVNDCANVLLAAGASPTMAHDPRETAQVAALAGAVVLNLGAVGEETAMVNAGQGANRAGRPVVFDPVGAGLSNLRRKVSARLLRQVKFAVIRGNASEIRALVQDRAAGSGVDASPADRVGADNLSRAAALAGELAGRTGAVVVLSGAVDVVSDGKRALALRGGCPAMARITGSGCMLSALTGAFCAVLPGDPFTAAVAAAACLGACGVRADKLGRAKGTGTATFRTDFMDGVSLITPEQLEEALDYDWI